MAGAAGMRTISLRRSASLFILAVVLVVAAPARAQLTPGAALGAAADRNATTYISSETLA